MSSFPPFDVVVSTPRLELRGATDDLLEQLAPAVRAGKANAATGVGPTNTVSLTAAVLAGR